MLLIAFPHHRGHYYFSQMKHKVKILAELNTKYQGFQKEILNRVADYLANTVTEETEIETAVENSDGLIRSFATFFQSETDRRVTEAVKKRESELMKDKAKDEAEPGAGKEEPEKDKDGKQDDESTKLLKMIAEQNKVLADRLAAIEGGKVVETRKQALEAKLKEAPASFKSKILKDFSRMQFESDEDFSAYLTETESDLGVAVQELADQGLGQQSKPLMGQVGDSETEVSPMMKTYLKSKAPKEEVKS